MIPYPYNMVDMGGIDLAEANGTVVEGLYAKIVEAVNACGDVVLYNWKFASIEIAPQHTQILLGSSSLTINSLIQVTELDVVTVLGIDPPPPPIVPVEPLTVNENGIYTAAPPASGFNPVIVQVESTGILEGNVPPSSDIGSDGDYYLYNAPVESYVFGITIIKAARGSDYNFTFWGARDIQIVFEDNNGDDVELSSILGAECYWCGNTGSFALQNGVIDGSTAAFYEHSTLPGYWKIVVPNTVTGYKAKALKICLRDASSYRDYYRTFNFGLWSANYELAGEPFVSVENSVQADWRFDTYNVFNFDPVELTGTEPYFYRKVNGEWVLVK